MQKVIPYLWFDDNAEEAVNFYVSVFKNARIGKVLYYGDAGPGPKGKVLTITFEIEGLELVALNGGPQFKFTEALSLCVDCATQAEVDELWDKLSAGGEEQQCGWLKDKYGLSWQIVPRVLIDLMQDKDPGKAQRVTEAMLKMVKIDIAALQRAYEQG